VLVESTVTDGVPLPARRASDLRLIEGAAAACASLHGAGLALVVVTNQPDVARGSLAREDLDAMHVLLRDWLPVDEIVVCAHDDADDCTCRKPRPGMILDAAERMGIDLRRSVLVGDRWRDIEAARRAGIASVHIDWGHGEPLTSPADATFGSLEQAVHHILRVTGTDDLADEPEQQAHLNRS
jgi:D-glycero-D-manno-heptose 1,7-bisphosphate phosphatase